MPIPIYKQSTSFPFVRLIFASLIGITIGYYLFSVLDHGKEKGTICLVIDDFGFVQNKDIEDFFHLNKNITAAIIPGTPYAGSISRYADSVGIETIIHMPMESHEDDDTEYPISLNEKLNATLVEEKVRFSFNEIPTALGMNNHQGSKATESLQLMKDLARTLNHLAK